MADLNARQLNFVNEYLKDRNATQAAIRAGYSEKSAFVIGSRLTRHPEVAKRIEHRLNNLPKVTDVTPEQIVKELAILAFLDPADFYDESGNLLEIRKMPHAARRALAGMDVEDLRRSGESIGQLRKVKFWNKREALSDLASILGMKQEVVGQAAFAINIHLTTDTPPPAIDVTPSRDESENHNG